MRKKLLLTGLIPFLLFFMAACGVSGGEAQSAASSSEKDSGDDTKSYLYQDQSTGIEVSETPGWQMGSEKKSKNNHITFNHENAKAIITSMKSGKSFADIKGELLLGSGKAEIIAEKADQLSFKSPVSKVRNDIYIKKKGGLTYILTFMTSEKNYNESQKDIQALLKNIDIK